MNFTIPNDKAQKFELFLDEFDLLEDIKSIKERDFWTTFTFNDSITEQEQTWIETEANNLINS